MDWLKEFKNPPKEYRSAPFWSWNDKLESEELKRQVREHAEKGLGGYFMHARIGLITPYMSEEWMDCVATCVEEGKRVGIASWLYDEDCWPSGVMGFRIPDKGEKYQQKALELVEADGARLEKEPELLEGAVKVFVASKVEGTKVEDLEEVTGKVPSPAELGEKRLIIFRLKHHQDYSDTLQPEVVKEFIRLQYEPYYERFGEEFGKAIPGIFTDEPGYNYLYIQGLTVPWTEDFAERFEAKWGYDIREHLPALFYDVEHFEQYRHDFYQAATEFYVEAYSKQIGEWCEEHKLQFTGHYAAEDIMEGQVAIIGSAMEHYEYMQLPGIDHLLRQIGSVVLPKQLSSVAHQLGKQRTLSETYGCSGWNASFEELKRIGDWQTVLGVNLFCQHLELYSMRGSRKRDYPPSLYYQQPYWEDYKPFMDYQARANYAMSLGKFSADLLLLHPINSARCYFNPKDNQQVRELDARFARVSETLLALQRDYDYGDEKLLAKYGAVEGNELRVGKMKYKVVVIPPAKSLEATTIKLLNEFLDAGGKVIVVRPSAYLVSGRRSEEAGKLTDRCVVVTEAKSELKWALDEAVPAAIRISDTAGNEVEDLYVQRRIVDERQEVWMVTNLSQERSHKARIWFDCLARVVEADLETGEARPISSRETEGGTVVAAEFAQAQSRVFILDKQREPQVLSEPKLFRTGSYKCKPEWELEVKEANALTLDYCKAAVGEGEFGEEEPIIRLSNRLKAEEKQQKVRMLLEFECRVEPDECKELFLVMEQPERYEIRCNGQQVEQQVLGWWKDISFQKLELKPYVQKGLNKLELATLYEPGWEQTELEPDLKRPNYHFTPKTELESVYVVGDFGVKQVAETKFALVERPKTAQTGDLVRQGLPFYSGGVVYRQRFNWGKLAPRERVYFEVAEVGAIVLKVRVNGQEAGTRYWRPLRVDVTDLLQEGENVLEVECIGSNRNLLGPHHHPKGELLGVDPAAFTGEPGWLAGGQRPWIKDYSFVPFGLTCSPELVVYEVV